MREVTLHLDGTHPIDIHCDGDNRPCNSFLLLANVPADPPAALLLSFGNSDKIANLIMTMWQRCVIEDPQAAWSLEQVSRAICTMADAERDKWPDDSRAGMA